MTAKQVQAIRGNLNLNRGQFGQLLSVSYKTIHRWETGGIKSLSNSSSDKLVALQQVLATQNGLLVVKEILDTEPRILGVATLSSIVLILRDALEINQVFVPVLLKTIQKLLKK